MIRLSLIEGGGDIFKESVFLPPFRLEKDELRGYSFFCLLIIRSVTSQQPLETSTVTTYSFHVICHISLLLYNKKWRRRYKKHSLSEKEISTPVFILCQYKNDVREGMLCNYSKIS
jgi:hypothetical protein